MNKTTKTKLRAWGISWLARMAKRICRDLGTANESVRAMVLGSDHRGSYHTLRPVESEQRGFSDTPYQPMDELFCGYEGSYVPRETDWGDDVGSEVIA
jgi:hypothetical protein